MGKSDTESLDAITQRLEALVEARLHGYLSSAEQREYQRLIELEAALLRDRDARLQDAGLQDAGLQDA